jgi:DNA replication licensing factor MCM2
MMREGMDGQGGDYGSDAGDDIAGTLDFEDVRGPLFIWLKKPEVIKFVNRQFDQFLRRF